MLKEVNVLIVGVGGQGTILASKILADVAQQQGYDVKVSEIHGMAQRGGSVVSQVRLGEKISSPIISEGHADIILAFEQLEALRYVHYLRENGVMIINDQIIEPVPVLLGLQAYPAGIIEKLKAKVGKVVTLNALELADKCGNKKATNVVLLGVLARKMDIPREVWEKAIERTVKAKFVEMNRKAFEAGWDAVAG